MVSMAHSRRTTPAPRPDCLADILTEAERTFVALVCEIGPTAADRYYDVVAKHGLPISLVKQCRAAFAINAVNYSDGDVQCAREAGMLRDLMPRLGKSMDSWLAKQFELTSHLVRSLRLHQGITTFDYSGQVPAHELGKSTDKALASKYGVPAFAIALERQHLGIGEMATVAGGDQPGIQQLTSIVARAKVMPELITRLGTATDTQLAAAFGLSGKTISSLRTHMGISKFSPYDKLAQNNPELVARLGGSTDAQLASEFGWSYESVNGLRRHLGIAKHRKNRSQKMHQA